MRLKNVRHACGRQDFDPVAVGIRDECDGFHLSILWPLDEGDAELLEAGARHIDVRNADTDMAEPAWFAIPIAMPREALVIFRPPIMGQFQCRFASEDELRAFGGIFRNCLILGEIGEKIQGEGHLGKVYLVQDRHAEYIAIEGHGNGRIADAQHCLVEVKAFGYIWTRYRKLLIYTGFKLANIEWMVG